MSMYPSNYYRPQYGQYGQPNSFGRMQQEFNATPNSFSRRQQEINNPLNQFSRQQQPQNYYGQTEPFRWQQDLASSGNPYNNPQPSFNPYPQQQPFFNPFNRQQPAFNLNNRQPPLNPYPQQQPNRRRPPIQDTLNTLMSHAGTINNGVNMLRQMGSLLASLR